MSDKNRNLVQHNQMRYAVIAEQPHHCHPMMRTFLRTFLNCTDIPESAVPIHAAQGGTVMTTTHVYLKTYYVRDRTGELRQVTTKTYIVQILKHDLLSGKMLNKAGYRIILDEDPEESGIFAVNEGKICK